MRYLSNSTASICYPAHSLTSRSESLHFNPDAFAEIAARTQIKDFVQTLGESVHDLARFKSAVRDFLIQLKEFSASDNAELYLEEKEAEAQRKATQDHARAANIPGMLKPSQIEDKDEEL